MSGGVSAGEVAEVLAFCDCGATVQTLRACPAELMKFLRPEDEGWNEAWKGAVMPVCAARSLPLTQHLCEVAFAAMHGSSGGSSSTASAGASTSVAEEKPVEKKHTINFATEEPKFSAELPTSSFAELSAFDFVSVSAKDVLDIVSGCEAPTDHDIERMIKDKGNRFPDYSEAPDASGVVSWLLNANPFALFFAFAQLGRLARLAVRLLSISKRSADGAAAGAARDAEVTFDFIADSIMKAVSQVVLSILTLAGRPSLVRIVKKYVALRGSSQLVHLMTLVPKPGGVSVPRPAQGGHWVWHFLATVIKNSLPGYRARVTRDGRDLADILMTKSSLTHTGFSDIESELVKMAFWDVLAPRSSSYKLLAARAEECVFKCFDSFYEEQLCKGQNHHLWHEWVKAKTAAGTLLGVRPRGDSDAKKKCATCGNDFQALSTGHEHCPPCWGKVRRVAGGPASAASARRLAAADAEGSENEARLVLL